MPSRVALVRGDDRCQNLRRALELIDKDIRLGERIVIKPNLVSIIRQLASTHAGALKAVLEYLRDRTSKEIVIAEGSASSDTFKGYRRFGFVDLAERYGARLVDLNRDSWVPVDLVDRRFRPLRLRIARTIAESDCRISLANMKTHDTVIVTLSLKNLVMGSLIRQHRDVGPLVGRFLHALGHWIRPRDPLLPPRFEWVARRVLRSDKMMIHQSYAAANYNLYLLAKAIPVHLAVIDGFTAMEGPGPTRGRPVDLRLAIASADFIAADTVGAHLMGFDPDDVGYLHHAIENGLGEGDLSRIEILGEPLEKCIRPFEPHPGTRRQLQWRLPEKEPARAV